MTIPIVVINYNSLTFMKRFLSQIMGLTDHIIIMDNCSTYPPLLEYYGFLESDEETKSKVTVHRFNENFGHNVYSIKAELLPDEYFLSDPDLELPGLSRGDLEMFLKVSETFGAGKVGCALDIEDHHLFIPGAYRDLFMNFERGYYTSPIPNEMGLELYDAPIDTTFCFVNRKASVATKHIRLGGRYRARHLPWYQHYLRDNIPMDELQYWCSHNISSSILEHVSEVELGIEKIVDNISFACI